MEIVFKLVGVSIVMLSLCKSNMLMQLYYFLCSIVLLSAENISERERERER